MKFHFMYVSCIKWGMLFYRDGMIYIRIVYTLWIHNIVRMSIMYVYTYYIMNNNIVCP